MSTKIKSNLQATIACCLSLMFAESAKLPAQDEPPVVEERAQDEAEKKVVTDEDEDDADEPQAAQAVMLANGMPSITRIKAAKKFELKQIYAIEIENMRTTCGLSDQQVMKLRVASKGATERFSKRWTKKYQKQMGMLGNQLGQKKDQKEEKEIVFNDADEIDEMTAQMLSQEFYSFGRSGGAPTDDKLWLKAVAAVLSDAQKEKQTAAIKSSLEATKRARIVYLLDILARDVLLTEDQSRKVEQLVRPLIKDLRITNSMYEWYLLMYYVSGVKEDELKNVLSKPQLQRWKLLFTPYKQVGQQLERQAEMMEENEEVDLVDEEVIDEAVESPPASIGKSDEDK